MKNLNKFLLAASLLSSLPASADVITLTFEGVGNMASVNDFYNGGTDSMGNSGTNYGINFTQASLGLIDADAGGGGNFANEPTPSTVLFFLSGSEATMNVAAGFTTGFSFYYSSSKAGYIHVHDQLNGQGNIIASLNLAQNYNSSNCTGDPTGNYCHWDPIGVGFTGTAYSVDFGGTTNEIGFDNVTLGSVNPAPEPASLALVGLGLAGLGAIRRRKHAA